MTNSLSLKTPESCSQLEGTIYASCGHKLTGDEGGDGFGFPTITLGDDCDFDGVHRCSFHGSACQKCYDEMKARNMLVTTEEADAWIKDGILPERMREPSVNNRDESHTPDSYKISNNLLLAR